MNEWWRYVTTVAGTDVGADIADATGIHQSMLSRWKTKGIKASEESIQAVVRFAKTYQRPADEVMRAAGWLPPKNDDPEDLNMLATIPTEDLAVELSQRLRGA